MHSLKAFIYTCINIFPSVHCQLAGLSAFDMTDLHYSGCDRLSMKGLLWLTPQSAGLSATVLRSRGSHCAMQVEMHTYGVTGRGCLHLPLSSS